MPRYHVYVPEVHYQTVEIEADSPKDAVKAVNDGNGDVLEGALEYSYTLDTDKRRVKCLATGIEVWADPYIVAGEEEEEEEED